MDLTRVSPENITLSFALVVAVVALWRFAIAGLKKRDDDRAEVVAAYKLMAEKSDENAVKLKAVIEADTTASRDLVKEVAELRRLVEKGRT